MKSLDTIKNKLKRVAKKNGDQRRFHAYCIGTSKSGTTSMAGLFQDNYRVAHQPEEELVIDQVMRLGDGLITQKEFSDFVRERDRRLNLEMDSSGLNYFLLGALVEEFENAKYILLVRDCYSWLESFINHQLKFTPSQYYINFREWRFKLNELKYNKQEEVLKEQGLYPIGCYLNYWSTQIENAIKIVPAEKLLIVRTHELAKSVEDIAKFLNISYESLNLNKSYLNKAPSKDSILDKVDQNFLQEKASIHCRKIMDELFPEVKSPWLV